jgi:hypothetical protein
MFQRKIMKPELTNGAPPGAIPSHHPSGWIQRHIFTGWFQHCIRFTKPTNEDSAVLAFDGHYSHTRNLDVTDMARENHLSFVCFPPHSTHRIQPPGVAFMWPFKTCYTQKTNTWLRNYPGRIVTHYQITGLMGKASLGLPLPEQLWTVHNAGIFPMNEHVFREHDFIIQEAETTAAEGQSSTSQADTEGSTGSPSTFVHTSVRCPHFRTQRQNVQKNKGMEQQFLWAVSRIETG